MMLILGAATWTLTEYLLHRFLGHWSVKPIIYGRFFKEHAKHHHKRNYFASTLDKILTTAALAPLAYFATGSWLFLAGFVGMYYGYELLHRRLHVVGPMHRYAAWMRAHHFAHHFGNDKLNHGVSTPVWDLVFGTYQKADVVVIPEKFRPQWIPESSNEWEDRYGFRYRVV